MVIEIVSICQQCVRTYRGLRPEQRDDPVPEVCYFCGVLTDSGLYVERITP